ncbi:MAG: Lrp/AsnC family transcriptional regulator [Candidatus Geothermarchaeales archaeon]
MSHHLPDFDLRLLSELQYGFPLSPEPFKALSERLGVEETPLLRRINHHVERGVIHKIAFLINQRATRYKEAALIGARVPAGMVGKVAEEINSRDEVTHNYLRNHRRYNLWFTFKAETGDKLREGVESLISRAGIDDHVLLPSKRVYKISYPKYDLKEGISRSPPTIEPEKVPTLQELGVKKDLAHDLAAGLSVENEPFRRIAQRNDLDVHELLSLIRELVARGVIRDWGAVLNGSRLGFKANAMVVLKVRPEEAEGICLDIVGVFEEVTHCVERFIVPGRWEYPAYFVVHALGEDRIEDFLNKVRDSLSVEECLPLYGVANLRRNRPILL